MKKVIFAISVIAATVFGASSCQREQAVQDEMPSGKKVTISFVAEKAGVDTKTAAVEEKDGVSYKWTEEDKDNIKLFTVKGDGSLDTEITDIMPSFSEDYRILTISAEVEANQSYTFRAILCSNYNGTGDFTGQNPAIKNIQTPFGNENIDPTADILVSDDYQLEVGENEESLLLTFHRQIVVNKMTLKGLNAGEFLNEVVIKSDKHLTGFLSNGAMVGQYKEITLLFDSVAIPENGEFDVYFVTMENAEQTLTVDVITDQYFYTKTFSKTIDFKLGYFTKFGVSLPEGQHVDDYSGYYLIACFNGGAWQLMDPNIGNNSFYPNFTSSVTTDAENVKFNEFTTAISNINNYLWRVDKYGEGHYSIKSVATGEYISASAEKSANSAQSLSDNTKFTIDINGTTATIYRNEAVGTLQYNSSSPRFTFYKSTQQSITLIPATYDERDLVTLSFERDVVQYTTADYEAFTGQNVVFAPENAAISDNEITWTIDDETDDIVSFFDSSTGSLTLNGNTGMATVTAFFAGDATYKAAQASYQIMVTSASAPKWVKTDINSIADGASVVIVDLNTQKAMTNDQGTQGNPAAVKVTLLPDFSQILEEPEGNIIWTFESSSDEDSFKFKAKDGYLYSIKPTSNNNNVLRVGSNTNNVFIFQDKFLYNTAAERYIGVYNSQDWRGYTSINDNIKNTVTAFYVLEDPRGFAPISWSAENGTAEITDNGTNTEELPTLDAAGLTVSYSSSDTKVATIDDAGIVTPLAAGMTTISATYTGTADSEYKNTTVQYTLTVIDSRTTTEPEQPSTNIYTLTLNVSTCGFNSESYAKNNGEHTVYAKSQNGEEDLPVIINSYQVYQATGSNSNNMQWQKNNGFLENTESLGAIKTITISSTAGNYNVYEGTQQSPNSTVSVSGSGTYSFSDGKGFFKIAVDNTATGTVNEIIVIFEK